MWKVFANDNSKRADRLAKLILRLDRKLQIARYEMKAVLTDTEFNDYLLYADTELAKRKVLNAALSNIVKEKSDNVRITSVEK